MILIVDDDAAIRSSLALLTRRAGYATRFAASPAEAMEQVRAKAPSLVLLDMNFFPVHLRGGGPDASQADKGVSSVSAGDTYDRLGLYRTRRGGDEGRGV